MNIHLGTGEFILSKRRGKGNMRSVPVERRDPGTHARAAGEGGQRLFALPWG